MWITGLNKAGNKRKRGEVEGDREVLNSGWFFKLFFSSDQMISEKGLSDMDYNPYQGMASHSMICITSI